MKKLISKVLILAMFISTLTVPVKADANSGTVLFEDDLNSASLISSVDAVEANVPFQWYGKDGAAIIDSNKALSTRGNNYTAAWEVPADLDVTQAYTLELTWAKKDGCEFMIYSKADDGKVNYERYLGAAGKNTYTVQIKFENGQIMRKRSVDSSYGNYSGASQKLWAVGLRQTANADSYIDNIVLKQGDKIWTEDFEDKSASEFQNQALKLSDYFRPAARFIESGAAGMGNRKLYLPAKSANHGAWSNFKIPAISNGVYEFSADYQVGRASGDYIHIVHESGNAKTFNFPNKTDSDAGQISRLKLTIDKDNNKVITSWIGADGTDKGSEFEMADETPVTCISFRTHNTAPQNAWLDNVQFKRISGSEEFNPEVSGEQLLAKADFEDYTKSKADYGFYSNGSSAYVGGKNGRGISAALTSGDYSYNERYMGYEFSNANSGEVLGEGRYHVRFAYNSYDNASRNDICFANAYNNSNAYKSVILSTETLNSFGNQWVDVDIEFEIPSRNWTATVVSPKGETHTASGTYSNSNNQIPAITWWIKPTANFKTTAAPAMDNFYVTKELSTTRLEDSAFTLISNQEVIGNANVPLTGVTALVDFGNDTAITSVSKENVKLLENGVEIDYNGYAEGTMWVINPGELNYGKTYVVSVEAGIPDGSGAYIKSRTFVFRTIKETVSETDLLYENDFNYTTEDEISSWYGIGGDNHEGFEYPFIASWGMSLVPGSEGNGITIDLNKDERDFELLIGYTHSGTYKLTYDFYPSAGTDVVNLCSVPDSWSGRTTLMERAGLPRQWLNVEIIVNLNKDTASISVRNDLGAEVYSNSIDNYTSSLAGFEFSRTVTGGTTGATLSKSSVFDNIMLCKLPGVEVPPSYVKGIFNSEGTKEYKTPAEFTQSEQISVKLECDDSEEEKTIVCFAGFYDENGKLIKAGISDDIEFSLTDTEKQAIFTVPENNTDVSGVKIFVWESLSNLTPVCNPYVICDQRWKLSKELSEMSAYNLVTTFYGDAGTTRGFAWTAIPGYTDMAIRYAKEDADWFSESIIVDAEYEEYQDMLFYIADIENLEPGESYVYKIGDRHDDEWSDFYSFKTEPENTSEFSFLGVADAQSNSWDSGFNYYRATLDSALNSYPDVRFMVNLGDMVETGNSYGQWNEYFDAVEGISESLPHMSAIGNHETRGDQFDSTKFYALHFNNPKNGVGILDDMPDVDSLNGVTRGIIRNFDDSAYSFDYGNTHFAVLNTGSDWDEEGAMKILAEQAEWLDEDLAETDKKWKIVMLHQSMYPAKTERYSTKAPLLEVIDKHKVDLVLQGHDHMVTRTYPMRNDAIVETSNPASVEKGTGTIYSILGSAGTKRYSALEQIPEYMAFLEATSSSKPVYYIFTVNDEKISVVAKQSDGTVVDSYEIVDN